MSTLLVRFLCTIEMILFVNVARLAISDELASSRPGLPLLAMLAFSKKLRRISNKRLCPTNA